MWRAFALASLLSTGIAAAWDEPTGFRDIPWGSQAALVQKKLPSLNCGKICLGYLRIADTKTLVEIGFETGGMDSVTLYFPSESFLQMTAAFAGRYGQPTSRRSEAVQNRMGVKSENEILEWAGDKVQVTLQRYGSTLTDGAGRIETLESYRSRVKRFQEKLKGGKKDL